MKKSAYMLLTIVAALAALFFLGYWMGIGIPLAAQATIFDKFERVLPAGGGKGQKIAGFGLGAELRDERGARAWRLRHGGERRGQVQRVHPVVPAAR